MAAPTTMPGVNYICADVIVAEHHDLLRAVLNAVMLRRGWAPEPDGAPVFALAVGLIPSVDEHRCEPPAAWRHPRNEGTRVSPSLAGGPRRWVGLAFGRAATRFRRIKGHGDLNTLTTALGKTAPSEAAASVALPFPASSPSQRRARTAQERS